MPEVHIYIETDSVSPRKGLKQYGYVLETPGDTRTREGFGAVKGTWHNATLYALIESVSRLLEPCEVHIHIPNEYVAYMLDKNLAGWAQTGFLGSKGKPVANREEWEVLWDLVKDQTIIPEPGHHAYSRWLIEEMKRRKEDV